MVTDEEIRQHLDRVVQSGSFVRSARMIRFLRHIVEHAGQGEMLTEAAIAAAVFDRPAGTDLRRDPIVRVEAGRLRAKLREYYAGEGAGETMRIVAPLRSYSPVFEESPREPVKATAAIAPNSIAVLQMGDFSTAGNQQAFCNGLSEEIAFAIGTAGGWRVAPRAAAWSDGMNCRTAYLIEGSARDDGSALRVLISCASTVTGYQIWTEAFSKELGEENVTAQKRIAQSVLARLRGI